MPKGGNLTNVVREVKNIKSISAQLCPGDASSAIKSKLDYIESELSSIKPPGLGQVDKGIIKTELRVLQNETNNSCDRTKKDIMTKTINNISKHALGEILNNAMITSASDNVGDAARKAAAAAEAARNATAAEAARNATAAEAAKNAAAAEAAKNAAADKRAQIEKNVAEARAKQNSEAAAEAARKAAAAAETARKAATAEAARKAEAAKKAAKEAQDNLIINKKNLELPTKPCSRCNPQGVQKIEFSINGNKKFLQSIGFNVEDNKKYHKEASLFVIKDRIEELNTVYKKLGKTLISNIDFKGLVLLTPKGHQSDLILRGVELNKEKDTYMAGGYYSKYLKYKAKYLDLKRNLE